MRLYISFSLIFKIFLQRIWNQFIQFKRKYISDFSNLPKINNERFHKQIPRFGNFPLILKWLFFNPYSIHIYTDLFLKIIFLFILRYAFGKSLELFIFHSTFVSGIIKDIDLKRILTYSGFIV